MRVYTVTCQGCSMTFFYATNVNPHLAIKGYATCPSCGAWTPFVEPRAARMPGVTTEIGLTVPTVLRLCRKP